MTLLQSYGDIQGVLPGGQNTAKND